MTPDNLELESIVEESLYSYPLAETPEGFSRGVMRRIHAGPRRRRSLFGWGDAVVLATLLVSAGAVSFGMQALPAFVTAPWRNQLLLLGRTLEMNLLWVLSFGGLLAGLVLMVWAVTEYWPGRRLRPAR